MAKSQNHETPKPVRARAHHRPAPPAPLKTPFEKIDLLNTLSASISQSPHLSDALNVTIERLLKITEADIGSIHLLDPVTQDLVMTASRGVTQSFIYNEERIAIGACLCGLAARSGEIVNSDDLSKDERLSRSACRDERFGSMISVPLRTQEKTLGILTLYSKRSHAFSKSNRQLLIAISHQIGVAIENSQLYARSKEAALLEERWLISRDLHDNIAQSLAYLNLQTKRMEERWRSELNDPDLEEFRHIRQVIQDTYQDVRNMLIDYRSQIKEDEALESVLEKHCSDFSARTGIKTEFLGDHPLPPIDPSVQNQVFRMIQESLSNVRKHARAGRVSVAVRAVGSGLRISIEDNGSGFDLQAAEATTRQQMGLSIMKERAAHLNGTVRITTAVGRGTVIHIDIPLNRTEG